MVMIYLNVCINIKKIYYYALLWLILNPHAHISGGDYPCDYSLWWTTPMHTTYLPSHYITVTQFQHILTISIAWEFVTN